MPRMECGELPGGSHRKLHIIPLPDKGPKRPISCGWSPCTLLQRLLTVTFPGALTFMPQYMGVLSVHMFRHHLGLQGGEHEGCGQCCSPCISSAVLRTTERLRWHGCTGG